MLQEHACLLAVVDDLDALYWATNRAARDLAAHLERHGYVDCLYSLACMACAAWLEGR